MRPLWSPDRRCRARVAPARAAPTPPGRARAIAPCSPRQPLALVTQPRPLPRPGSPSQACKGPAPPCHPLCGSGGTYCGVCAGDGGGRAAAPAQRPLGRKHRGGGALHALWPRPSHDCARKGRGKGKVGARGLPQPSGEVAECTRSAITTTVAAQLDYQGSDPGAESRGCALPQAPSSGRGQRPRSRSLGLQPPHACDWRPHGRGSKCKRPLWTQAGGTLRPWCSTLLPLLDGRSGVHGAWGAILPSPPLGHSAALATYNEPPGPYGGAIALLVAQIAPLPSQQARLG